VTIYVREAANPKGDRFLVTIAPPGSMLDSHLASSAPGWVGALLTFGGLFGSVHRLSKPGWRLSVERFRDGPFGYSLTVYRERVGDEQTAGERAAVIASGITAGTWYPGLETPAA
jgi:hypothetical protein